MLKNIVDLVAQFPDGFLKQHEAHLQTVTIRFGHVQDETSVLYNSSFTFVHYVAEQLPRSHASDNLFYIANPSRLPVNVPIHFNAWWDGYVL